LNKDILPKIMDVVVPKWMIICCDQTKFGGEKNGNKMKNDDNVCKHCKNG
jgi:hypothetical protein